MSKWKDPNPAVRDNATYEFCKKLDEDPGLRSDCLDKTKPLAAWTALRDAGNFEDMPPNAEVRVFEEPVDSNDVLVTMVIPAQNQVPPPGAFEAKKVWRCTWAHYLELKNDASKRSAKPR